MNSQQALIQLRLRNLAFGLPHVQPHQQVGKSHIIGQPGNYRELQASNPRDYAYGLLVISQRSQIFDASIISVDYSKSEVVMYTDTAIDTIRQEKDLRMLDHIHRYRDFTLGSSCPSWVPRWNLFRRWLGFPRVQVTVFAAISRKDFRDQQERDEISKVREKMLQVYGLTFGSIAWVSIAIDWDGEEDDVTQPEQICSFKAALRNWWSDCVSDPPENRDHSKDIMLMARTFAVGRIVYLKHPLTVNDKEQNQIFADSLDTLQRAVGQSFWNYVGVLLDGQYITESTNMPCTRTWKRSCRIANVACSNRILFQTGSGVHGIGLDCMVKGGIIVALFGTFSLYALRPVEGGFLSGPSLHRSSNG